MPRVTLPLLITLFPAVALAVEVPELTALRKQASAIRPPAAAFTWQQIPWHTEPEPALKEARAENRPLFVWLAGGRDRDGSPLERC